MTSIGRRALLGGMLAGSAAAALAETAQSAPAAGVDGRPRPGVDGLLALFKATPVVAMGEGAHHLQESWDFLAAAMFHPGFRTVDAIVIEVGNSRHQAIADDYVTGEIVRRSELQKVWRDTTQSPLNTGDIPAFERVFSLARAINLCTPRPRPLRVLLADPPIDWSQIHDRDDLLPFMTQRDANWSGVVIDEVLAEGRRCLIIGGQGHLFRNLTVDGSGTVDRIERSHPGSVSIVHTHSVVAEGKAASVEQHVTGWARPSIASARHTPYGRLPAVDIFPGTRYPPGFLERLRDMTVADLTDHVLFLGARRQLTAAVPDWEVYYEPTSWAELNRRKAVTGFPGNLDELRQETDPAMFPQDR